MLYKCMNNAVHQMLRPLRPGTGFLRPDAQKGISLRLQGLVGLPPKEDAGLAYAQQCWLPGAAPMPLT